MLKSILSIAFWSDVFSVVIAIVIGDFEMAWIRARRRRRGWDFA